MYTQTLYKYIDIYIYIYIYREREQYVDDKECKIYRAAKDLLFQSEGDDDEGENRMYRCWPIWC